MHLLRFDLASRRSDQRALLPCCTTSAVELALVTVAGSNTCGFHWNDGGKEPFTLTIGLLPARNAAAFIQFMLPLAIGDWYSWREYWLQRA
jgi:hypothetical protein